MAVRSIKRRSKHHNSSDVLTDIVKESLRLAAIDVGTNSVHMIVAQADSDGGVTTLWREKEMVGLGRISFPSHQLSTEAMDRAVASLSRMKQAAQQRQAEKIVAVATSAIREAINGGDLIERIRRELKLHVRVVSAREEARLIYLGVKSATDLGNKPHLIIDIGGGSVEFIVGDNAEAKLLESRKLGASRMTATFIKSDPPNQSDLDQLHLNFNKELKSLSTRILALKPIKVIGTSGTLENIAQMCNSDLHEIDYDRLLKLESKLLKTTSADRAKLGGLDGHRKDQIIAGVQLTSYLMRTLKIRKIEMVGAALREGILSDYLARHIPDLKIRREIPDPRRRSILDLARRCNWYESHSSHVARLCMRLFDDLKPLHGLGNTERELIEYAAMLHDIGWHIDAEKHHKHSQYLILNGKLNNFLEDEIKVIAKIARFHRKSTPDIKKHSVYASLNRHYRKVVDIGTALLRIADGLDRSKAGAVQNVKCKIIGKTVQCTVYSPVDPQLEIWGARTKREWFETAFKHKLEFIIAAGK